MGKTIHKEKYKRDHFNGEAAMEKAHQEGLLGKGRDANGDWFGKDTRGHNQIWWDECIAVRNDPYTCPCKKCERLIKCATS